MTKSARAWAWEQYAYGNGIETWALTGPQKVVLLCLAEHENYEWGVAFPSVARIAKRCCVVTRTVDNALKALEDAHFITRGKRRREDGKWAQNTYELHVTAEYRMDDSKWIQIHGEPEPDAVASTWERALSDPLGFNDPTPF